MQRNKVNRKIDELKNISENEQEKALSEVMGAFKVRDGLACFDSAKKFGLTISTGLAILLILPFLGIDNIWKMYATGWAKKEDIESEKDSYYSIKNNEKIGWRFLLLLMGQRFIYLCKKNKLDKEGVKALIIDDSTIEKTGKKIEGVGMVHDHVSGKFVLGFKLLVCGFWDGGSFIPIDFSFHRERGKKLKEAELKVKRLEEKIEKVKANINNATNRLSAKQEASKVAKNNFTINGGKTRENKYLSTQKAVSKAQNHLSEQESILELRCKELEDLKKKLTKIKEERVYYGLSKKENESQYSKKRNGNTNGAKRKKELNNKKTDNTVKMIKRAIHKGFIPDYIITDSWFFNLSLLQCIFELRHGVNLISMAAIGIIKYTETISGKSYYPKELIAKHSRKKLKYSRKLKAEYFKVPALYGGYRVDLYFIKMGSNKTFRLLITTDLTISFVKLMEAYQIRWSIEVFFKECKQYLNLGKCCSNDFDGQIADASLIMIRYMMLSYYKRINYQSSIGGLFEELSKNMIEASLAKRLWQLLIDLLVELANLIAIDIPELFVEILRCDKSYEKFLKIIEIPQNT